MSEWPALASPSRAPRNLAEGGGRKRVHPLCLFSFRNFPREDHQPGPGKDPFSDVWLSSLSKKNTPGSFSENRVATLLPAIKTEGGGWGSRGAAPNLKQVPGPRHCSGGVSALGPLSGLSPPPAVSEGAAPSLPVAVTAALWLLFL